MLVILAVGVLLVVIGVVLRVVWKFAAALDDLDTQRGGK